MTKQEIMQAFCENCGNKEMCSSPCTAAALYLSGIDPEQLWKIIHEICEKVKMALDSISDIAQAIAAFWENIQEKDREELISRAQAIHLEQEKVKELEREYAALWCYYMVKVLKNHLK